MAATGQIRILIALAGIAAMSLPAIAQSQNSLDAKAAAAHTAAQHAAVAKEYRLQAEALNAQAAEHEKNVKQLVRATPQLQKWPGLASGQLQKEKSQAIEARRAAREAAELAARHIQLAVETQAQPESTSAGN